MAKIKMGKVIEFHYPEPKLTKESIKPAELPAPSAPEVATTPSGISAPAEFVLKCLAEKVGSIDELVVCVKYREGHCGFFGNSQDIPHAMLLLNMVTHEITQTYVALAHEKGPTHAS